MRAIAFVPAFVEDRRDAAGLEARTGRATARLIFGHVGTGKTTFARRLERELPGICFSHDAWMTRLHGSDPPADTFRERAQVVSVLMEEVWTRCLFLGLDVVLDFGFWTRRERDATREVVRRLGAASVLYRLACPETEAWARVEGRNREPGEHLTIARATFDALRQRVEPLGPDEERVDVAGSGLPTAVAGAMRR
ncbi:AAA family ATPase [Roseomonas sp. CCTCC AB2023176]|uniref:AAA family ATPase n=1 Tax=Roseomonas sp. CCTCC AB2023176 TaxID=3342640 RepID=UPI0035DFF98E